MPQAYVSTQGRALLPYDTAFFRRGFYVELAPSGSLGLYLMFFWVAVIEMGKILLKYLPLQVQDSVKTSRKPPPRQIRWGA
jgi:hypothetical protein